MLSTISLSNVQSSKTLAVIAEDGKHPSYGISVVIIYPLSLSLFPRVGSTLDRGGRGLKGDKDLCLCHTPQTNLAYALWAWPGFAAPITQEPHPTNFSLALEDLPPKMTN